MKKHCMLISLLYGCAYVMWAFCVSSFLASCGGGEKELIPPIVPGQKLVKLTGTVRDQAGKPISGATIEARSLQDELLGTTKSDKDGKWELNLYLPVGVKNIRLKISAAGYEDTTRDVPLSEGYNPPVDVTLTTVTLMPPPPPTFSE
jgi:hypothetical protein